MLIALGRCSSAARYSAKSSQPQGIPALSAGKGMSSTTANMWVRYSRSSGRHGASVNPQLPVITLVTPCQDEDVHSGSQKTWAS